MPLPNVLLAEIPTELMVGISIVVIVFGLVFVAVFFRYIQLWIQCKMTRAGISFPNLVMMSLRKVNPTIIVRSKIMAVQAGLTYDYPISTRQLEAHYLAGGSVPNVIRALIAAHRAAGRSGHRPGWPRHSGCRQDERLSEGD